MTGSLQGSILTTSGFTSYVLSALEKPYGFIVHGKPATLGGPNKIDANLLCSCVERLQAFYTLTLQTLKAEFPGHDLLSAFSAFNLATVAKDIENKGFLRLSKACNVNVDRLRKQVSDLKPVALYESATGAKTVYQAWKAAITRLKSRKSWMECDVLETVLAFYGSWNGLTSSGVEQNFSLLDRAIPKERRLMAESTNLDETQLLLRDPNLGTSELFQKAQAVWRNNFGSVRKSCLDRLDRGVPRGRKQDRSLLFNPCFWHGNFQSFNVFHSLPCPKYEHSERLVSL